MCKRKGTVSHFGFSKCKLTNKKKSRDFKSVKCKEHKKIEKISQCVSSKPAFTNHPYNLVLVTLWKLCVSINVSGFPRGDSSHGISISWIEPSKVLVARPNIFNTDNHQLNAWLVGPVLHCKLHMDLDCNRTPATKPQKDRFSARKPTSTHFINLMGKMQNQNAFSVKLPSFYIYVYICISMSISISIYLSTYPSIYLYMYIVVCTSYTPRAFMQKRGGGLR